MNLRDYAHPELILLDQEFSNRNSAITFMAEKLDKAGKLNDKQAFINAVLERENEGPTALGEHLAIPHGKSSAVKHTCIAVARLKKDMHWEGLDGPEPVNLIIMLAIEPEDQGNTHIQLLTDISTHLVRDDVRAAMRAAENADAFLEVLNPQWAGGEHTGEEIKEAMKTVVCVTACPTGIAHTYMAAEYLEKAGKKLGVQVYVEKQGSKGVEGELTAEQLAKADAAIIAADVAIKDEERFAHLPVLKTKVAEPIRRGEAVIKKALSLPPVSEKSKRKIKSSGNCEKLSPLEQVKQALLTGVSHAIPLIAAGGIMIAMAIAFAPMTSEGPDFTNTPILKLIIDIGGAAFSILLPVLAGYIAYGVAGRPGLVAGFVGGYLAGTTGAGFLGAIIAGLIAGYVSAWVKGWKIHRSLEPIMPILIIPIISSMIVGTFMLKIIGAPIAGIMEGLGEWLRAMGDTNAIILGLILGCMVAFDMGGPINKAAFFFGAAMIHEGNYAIMGAVAAAICVPPISMGIATKLSKSLWTDMEQEAGTAGIIMGMIGITEGAIPFAVADPLRVIPSIMTGSAVASAIAMSFGVGNHAPHGGPIVLPVIDGRIMYVVAITVGVMVSALMVNALKRVSQGKKNKQPETASA